MLDFTKLVPKAPKPYKSADFASWITRVYKKFFKIDITVEQLAIITMVVQTDFYIQYCRWITANELYLYKDGFLMGKSFERRFRNGRLYHHRTVLVPNTTRGQLEFLLKRIYRYGKMPYKDLIYNYYLSNKRVVAVMDYAGESNKPCSLSTNAIMDLLRPDGICFEKLNLGDKIPEYAAKIGRVTDCNRSVTDETNHL